MLEAIGHLPEDEREALDLVRIQRLSQAEAARMLGVFAMTVNRRRTAIRTLVERLVLRSCSDDQLSRGSRGRSSYSVGLRATNHARPPAYLWCLYHGLSGVTPTRRSDASPLSEAVGPGPSFGSPATFGAIWILRTGVGGDLTPLDERNRPRRRSPG
ncbi:sigma factor-like helix-turn-helix DNA-binding protein [Paludisphaera mucosa]|uniref:Sigma factor-like helix-turn-helix DNA-binding protein n=1 Tax=Paludisphaera mucosa TaxID=3030827 RepID=A0ABT6FEA8_9BACT|nr:sigma factor-like helix-turn-helix DNA-binding protein [Paludisphaera mucosa]